jgi:hypothetical protein
MFTLVIALFLCRRPVMLATFAAIAVALFTTGSA